MSIKSTVVNLIAKWTGLGWVWDKIDGHKTKIGSVAAILSGAGGVLAQLVPLIAAQDFGAVLAWAQGLPADPAWQLLVGGFIGLGIGHKIDKAAASPTEPSK